MSPIMSQGVAVVVAAVLIAPVGAYEEGRMDELSLHDFSGRYVMPYPWIASLLDFENLNITCTASIILAHFSLTACECLVEKPTNSTLKKPKLKQPGTRYVVVGGVMLRNFDDNLEELSTTKFIVHDECRYDNRSDSWFYNYGIALHEPFEKSPRISSPMPVWSAEPDDIETQFHRIVSSGAPCYIIGWQNKQRRAVKITVTITHEPPEMENTKISRKRKTRLSCLMKDLLLRRHKSAVSCTSNQSLAPYCHLEPGMPVVCGHFNDVFAITSSFPCDAYGQRPNSEIYVPLWKLSIAMDWLRKKQGEEIEEQEHSEEEEVGRIAHELHPSRTANWKFNKLGLVLLPANLIRMRDVLR